MKTLIAYFTWSNHTKDLVDGVRRAKGYDVLRIERKVPYSTDYRTCAYVEAKAEYEKKILPEIKPIEKNVDEYERILLFFPVWWYTFPMPVGKFVEEIKGYQGEIVVFANSYTNDPQYMQNALRDLQKIAPNVRVERGLFNRPLQEHLTFIK